MAADASIFSQLLQPARSVQDYSNDLDKRELNQLQLLGQRRANDLADAQAEQTRNVTTQRNALRDLVQSGQIDLTNPQHVSRALSVAPDVAPALLKTVQDQQTSSAKAGLDAAQAGEAAQKTKEASRKAAVGQVLSFNSPDDAIAHLNSQVSSGAVPMQYAILMQKAIKNDPNWKANLAVGIQDPQHLKDWLLPHFMNAGGALVNTVPTAGPVGQGQPNAIPITQGADNAATIAGENQRAAASRQQALTLANRGVVHDTDAGTMLIDPRTGEAKAITNPANGEQVGKPLKTLPPAVNDAIIGNAQSLYTLDKAIALLGGKNVDAAKGDKEATGWKGYLPQWALNRVDPSGIDARAEVADIGSLKIHDRSGAAVTISESPRLMPFIPQATDLPDVVVKKLTRLKEEATRNQQALSDTYSKDQGYKPSPVKMQPSASASGGNSVTTPDGKVHTFPDAAKAAAFKKAAGL